ncbi:MAG: hypothetical protein R2911_28290 [Caldilineaceae bacterium]
MTKHPSTPTSNRTIPERWLPVVWVGWLIYALVVLTIHIQGTPLYLADLQAPASSIVGAWERPTYGDAALLPQLGLSLAWYARYISAWAILYGVTLYAAGIFIFWRRSQEIMALIVSITLLSLSLGENSIDHLLKQTYPWWNWPVEFNQMVGAVLLLWIGYLFPNGRFVPTWTPWLVIGWSVMNFFWFLFPEIPLNHLYGETAERHLLATFLLVTGCYLTGLYAQIYRYRHVSTYEQRTQTRWVLLGFGANFLNTAVRFLPLALAPALNEPGLLAHPHFGGLPAGQSPGHDQPNYIHHRAAALSPVAGGSHPQPRHGLHAPHRRPHRHLFDWPVWRPLAAAQLGRTHLSGDYLCGHSGSGAALCAHSQPHSTRH